MSRLVACLIPCLLLPLLAEAWDYSSASADSPNPFRMSGIADGGGLKDVHSDQMPNAKKSFLDAIPWFSTQHLKRQQMRYQQCYFNPISCF